MNLFKPFLNATKYSTLVWETRILFPPNLFQSLTIHQATLDDQGSYVCEVTDHSENRQSKGEFVRILEKEEPFLRTYYEGFQTIEKMEDDKDIVRWVLQIESHPKPAVVW